jgi:hypothetical protein
MEYRNIYIENKQRLSASDFKKQDAYNQEKKLYPYNITFSNYCRYLLIPGVVYEQDFPSTLRFNIFYFMGHFIFAFANVFL